MKHLVFLDTGAGELEKILSGTKTMLVREYNPAETAANPVSPGDRLYFLRDRDDCAVRVSATVVRVLFRANGPDEELSHSLKEMQPRLQLTEAQYDHWSARERVLLVEFESAQKIGVIHVAPEKLTDRPAWVAFEEFSQFTQPEVA